MTTEERFIYHVYRTDDIGYDEVSSFVVCARDSKSARNMAANECGGEGIDAWLSGRRKSGHQSKVRKLGPARVPNGYPAAERIICRSYHAG